MGTFIIPICQMSKTKAQREQSQEWAGCRGSQGEPAGRENRDSELGKWRVTERGMMETEIQMGRREG